jgi:integrase
VCQAPLNLPRDRRPFALLTWPRRERTPIDPFTVEERDQLIAWFWERRRHYWPFVLTAFGTGMRPSELCGLRWGDVDLRAGQLDVKRSRTMHEDHATKTHGSERTVRLPSAVVAALRGLLPLHVEPDAFVFQNVQNDPIHAESFTKHEWSAAIRATGVRARKFYAARHTCSSVLLSAGVPAKLVAEQLGTSLAMLQLHYGRYMATASDTLDAALGLDSETVPERSPNRDRKRDRAKVSR